MVALFGASSWLAAQGECSRTLSINLKDREY